MCNVLACSISLITKLIALTLLGEQMHNKWSHLNWINTELAGAQYWHYCLATAALQQNLLHFWSLHDWFCYFNNVKLLWNHLYSINWYKTKSDMTDLLTLGGWPPWVSWCLMGSVAQGSKTAFNLHQKCLYFLLFYFCFMKSLF